MLWEETCLGINVQLKITSSNDGVSQWEWKYTNISNSSLYEIQQPTQYRDLTIDWM